MIAGVALSIAVLCLAGIIGVLLLLLSIRQKQEQTLTAEVGSRIGAHGLWVGAWLVGITASQAERVGEIAAELTTPGEILRVWDGAGSHVISHVTGPEVITESEARGWMEVANKELLRTRVPERVGLARERVFALLYISRNAPPVTAQTVNELHVFLQRPGTLGAVFVACPTARDRGRGLWTAVVIAGVVLFATGLSAAVIGIVAPTPEPRPATTSTSTGSSAPTAAPVVTAVVTNEPSPSASPSASGAPAAPSTAKIPLQTKQHK